MQISSIAGALQATLVADAPEPSSAAQHGRPGGGAGALASEEYRRIDLSGAVSKYIGETEKNLGAAFGNADRAEASLRFDEADALFGRRTDVQDAHGRDTSPDVNALLQGVECHDGVKNLVTSTPHPSPPC